MSYLFPRRVLRSADVLDPIELTLDISPAAERLSGRLNAHNFRETIASTVPVEEDAFYKTHYTKVVSDPKFGTPGAYTFPTFPGTAGADPEAYRVTNTFEWQTIDNSAAAPLSLTIAAGTSVFWVNAFVQYLWNGFTLSPAVLNHLYAGDSVRPCGVQFAIRLDGSVLPDTITGIDLVDFRSSLPLKPIEPRTEVTLLPGPQDIRGNVASALGPPALPIRITACIPVQAGDHTVELVVRRMPLVADEDVTTTFDTNDFVAVFNRQLAVVELKSFPIDSVTAESVSAPGWDEEELVSQATIYTNRVDPIIDGYNEVKAGNVQRGALMHYHLPAALHKVDTAERQFASLQDFNNFYPGFASTTTTATKFAGAPGTGWYLLSSGSALFDIKTTQTFDMANLGGLVLVLANTQVVNIANTASALQFNSQFAAFRIMYKLVGDPTWYALEESTGYVNSFVTFLSANKGVERAEVALMGIIDTQDLPGGSQIETIALFGAAITDPSTAAPPYTFYQIRRGSILALHMRS